MGLDILYVEDARTYFARVGADLIAHFARLGSKCVELETDERLRIVHDFFRVGEETAYHFNIKKKKKKGHDFKDYVCPDTMEFEKDERIFTISKSYLHHEMDRGAKLAGVKRIRIHGLRHSHASLSQGYF